MKNAKCDLSFIYLFIDIYRAGPFKDKRTVETTKKEKRKKIIMFFPGDLKMLKV